MTIDGCDEADDALTLIKGGGGCQTQEKVCILSHDEYFVKAESNHGKQDLLDYSDNFVGSG